MTLDMSVMQALVLVAVVAVAAKADWYPGFPVMRRKVGTEPVRIFGTGCARTESTEESEGGGRAGKKYCGRVKHRRVFVHAHSSNG